MPSEVENVACTVCGCVCDDLRVTVDGGRIVRAVGACRLAEPWLLAQNARRPPAAEIDGRPAAPADAVARAVEILRAARYPLIYGLSRSSTAGQRSAIALAERLGAVIDTTASLCHAPSVVALQESGESCCTLGEVRNRADLVIFWGSDPVVSHPRHLERYSADPPGLFVPRGRAGRFVVVADVRRTATADAADLFLPVEPGRDFEALWTLRGLVRDIVPRPGTPTGAPLPLLEELAGRMKACCCGAAFFGLGLTGSGAGHRSVEALLRLVTDLNDFTRWYARRMRVQGDVAGADSVLAWQTGYPFSVNLARGYPRYGPDEFSVREVLGRGEADACLLVGTEGVAELPPDARAHLGRIPVIALDAPEADPPLPLAVRFVTAVHGVHLPGTAYRMDEVPVPLRAVLPTLYPSDAEVLGRIAAALDESAPGSGPSL